MLQLKKAVTDNRDIVVIECREKERCARIRAALEAEGFEVYGSCDSRPPAEAAHVHIDPPLTAQDLNVLQALCTHGSQQAAAKALGITTKSLDNYLSRIRAKLDIPSTLELALFALRKGLVE